MRRLVTALTLVAVNMLAACGGQATTLPQSGAPATAASAASAPASTPLVAATPTTSATPAPSPVAAPTEAAAVTPAPASTATPKAAREFPAGFVSAREATGHVGKVAMVCGTVASADYVETSNGAPTFLNLDQPYPDQVFTIVIWEEHRASFGGAPEEVFARTRVCIKGLVERYNGIAQIVASGGDIEVYE